MTAIATIARGDASRVTDRRRVVAKTPDEWVALWAAHAGPEAAAPAIDFASSIVAAAFAGVRPSAGHSIEVVGAVEEDGGTRLVVDERSPGPGAAAAQIVTAPFHIVQLPRADGEIRWTDASRTRPAPADVHGRIARGAHSHHTATGLRPRTAAVLSYLAGPVSGVIMLIAEPAQPFVRFHAWQSVIALGALSVAVAICYALGFASLFFSANGLAVMVRAATAVWIALWLVWLVCLWQAWKGHAWKLPVVGAWAERLASRG
jgi:uncharacterized membrane protein